MNIGSVELNFGSAPGTNIVEETVSAPGMTTESVAEAYFQGDSTVDHNAEEHKLLSSMVGLVCSPAVDQFVVRATTSLRLSGLIKIRYVWSI